MRWDECHTAIAGWNKLSHREKGRVDRVDKKHARQEAKKEMRDQERG